MVIPMEKSRILVWFHKGGSYFWPKKKQQKKTSLTNTKKPRAKLTEFNWTAVPQKKDMMNDAWGDEVFKIMIEVSN